jgi:SAM-dependent methyltransferase
MKDKIKDIISKSDISEAEKYYWGYMYDLGRIFIVPHITSLNAFKKGDKVAEIGSAEGGVLHAFIAEGATEALGTDIAKDRLLKGEYISKLAGLNVKYQYHDIVNQEPFDEWKEKYDLVILRDVIEHLDNPQSALQNIYKIIKPGGFLYVTFPPYNSPYGGHQHTLAGNFLTKLPWIHHLPKSIFLNLIKSGRPQDIEEVTRLLSIRFSPEKFESASINSKFSIFKKEFYLIRPVYKMKFGLQPVKMNILTNLSFIRNYFCLEASYILKK